jgi:hypothetical protein
MSDEEKIVRRDPDIELLGQKLSYPRRWQGVFVVLILSVTLVVVAYIILVQSRPENLQTLGLFTGNIQIGDDFIKKRDKFGFEFWTPSTHTAIAMDDYLERFPEKSVEYQWQMHDEKTNDIRQKNIRFGELLLDHPDISGYRRYEVVGKSTTVEKTGWWWVVGVDGAYSDDFFSWFARTYKTHWGLRTDDTIYVEVSAIDRQK